MNTQNTKLFGLIGLDVTHSASPAMHNAAFQALGINAQYHLLPVEEDALPESFRNFMRAEFSGFNVTYPYKQAVIASNLLDTLNEAAQRIGAVNTMCVKDGAVHGYNTDGIGFVRAFEEQFGAIDKKKIVLVGCGGAGSAVAIQACMSGVSSLVIADIDADRIDVLKEKILRVNPDCELVTCLVSDDVFPEAVQAAQVLIDATPIGMNDDDPQSPLAACIEARHIVCDLVYHPPLTPLLKTAKKKKAKVMNGFGMLLFQGVEAFEIWTGKTAPVDVMRKALDKKVYG